MNKPDCPNSVAADASLQEFDGGLVAKDLQPIRVSEKWTDEERGRVRALFARELARLKMCVAEMRKTFKWEAPYFAQNEIQQKELMRMSQYLSTMPAEWLELNRANFHPYIC